MNPILRKTAALATLAAALILLAIGCAAYNESSSSQTGGTSMQGTPTKADTAATPTPSATPGDTSGTKP